HHTIWLRCIASENPNAVRKIRLERVYTVFWRTIPRPASRPPAIHAAVIMSSSATATDNTMGHQRGSAPNGRDSSAHPSGDSHITKVSVTSPTPRNTYAATSKPKLVAYTSRARSTTCATTADMPAKTRPNAASETGYMMAPGDDTCTAPSAALIAAHA